MHADDSSAELKELGPRSLETTADLIAQAQRVGDARAGDPARLAHVAFSALHGLATPALGSLLDDTPPAEATSLAIDVLLTGLGFSR